MIGKTISHYEIIEKLGEGGMGVVYKARDTKLDRFVAVKFLPPHLSSNEAAASRFVHEAKAASALNHPNVGTIYEIDETPDGMTFIVMAYYEGESLRSVIDKGKIPLEQTLEIVSQVASGIARAHEKGIVHRDIKPSNILITNDERVEIIDFGLAMLAGSTRLTMEESTLGTAAYMSPEQAKGEEVDHRSDIFSLGVILCEMLSGSPPFKGEHEAALLYEIVHEQPEQIANCRADLPEGLQVVVNKAMEKNASDRYQSVLEFADDLERFRERSSSTSSAAGRTAASRDAVGRRRTAIIVAITALAIMTSVIVIKWLISSPEHEEPLLAIVDFTELSYTDDYSLSVGFTGLVHTGLVESSPCRVISPTYLQDIRRRRFGQKRGPIEHNEALEVARESGANMLLSGQIMPGDEAYVTWDLVDIVSGKSLAAKRLPGENLMDLADEIVENILPLLSKQCGIEITESPRSVTELTTADPQAYRHYVAGLLAREENRNLEELEHLEKAVTIDTLFAKAYYELSRYYSRESGQARVYADKAWELRSRLGTKDLMLLEAWRQWVDYRIQDALATYRQLLAQWPDDRDVLESLMNKLYGNWYAPEAMRIAEKGMSLYPEDISFSRIHLYCLDLDAQADQALEAARDLVRIHPLNPSAVDDLGLQYAWMGMPDSADAAYSRALKLEPEYMWSVLGLGANRYFRGDVPGAIEAYEKILERADLTDLDRLWIFNQTVNIYPGLFVLYAEAGRYKEAIATLERSRRYATDTESELRHYYSPRNSLLLRIGRAKEVLAWARITRDSDNRIAKLRALVAEGLALAALDSIESAGAAAEELRAAEPFWGGFASYTALKIDAMTALSVGDPETALAMLQKIRSDHGIPLGSLQGIEYMEILAQAYKFAGRPAEAVGVHKDMLRLYGGHALSHYELGKLYEEMNRPADARREYGIFLETWRDADEGLPQPEDARRRLASLTSG